MHPRPVPGARDRPLPRGQRHWWSTGSAPGSRRPAWRSSGLSTRSVGGLSEDLPINFGDVDLSLKVRAGRLPDPVDGRAPTAYHFEATDAGTRSSSPARPAPSTAGGTPAQPRPLPAPPAREPAARPWTASRQGSGPRALAVAPYSAGQGEPAAAELPLALLWPAGTAAEVPGVLVLTTSARATPAGPRRPGR